MPHSIKRVRGADSASRATDSECEPDIPTVKCARGLNLLVLSSLVLLVKLFVPVLDNADDGLCFGVGFYGLRVAMEQKTVLSG